LHSTPTVYKELPLARTISYWRLPLAFNTELCDSCYNFSYLLNKCCGHKTSRLTFKSVAVCVGRLRLTCDGTRAETIFRLSAKRTSPFKSAGASVQSTTGSQGERISGSNAGYTKFRGSVKGTGFPLHSPVFPSLPLPCVTVCHHISTGLYGTEFLALKILLAHQMQQKPGPFLKGQTEAARYALVAFQPDIKLRKN
jgi:hypothetical protein